jgi:hypothetical protein
MWMLTNLEDSKKLHVNCLEEAVSGFTVEKASDLKSSKVLELLIKTMSLVSNFQKTINSPSKIAIDEHD